MGDDIKLIKCQNCDRELGKKLNGQTISLKPSEIDFMVQEINKDATIFTIKCPECGCFVQIIS